MLKLWKKWMKPTIMVECYLCEGKGVTHVYDPPLREPLRVITNTCSKCNGTGVVKE